MKKLVIVDADPFSLCLLDVGLRKIGYSVTTAGDGADGWAKIDAAVPDAIVADTRLPKLDGFALVRKLKERVDLSRIPVIFLVTQESVADRERALELGVHDYLAKPAYLCELAARIDLLVARSTRQQVASTEGAAFGRNRLAGSTNDFALTDLILSFERTRKSGVVYVRNEAQEAQIFFRDGKVIDARLGGQRGEEAIYRALIWGEASFEVELKAVSSEDVIGGSTHAILMKAMRRVDDWVRLCEQVQPLATLLDVHPPLLVERLSRMGEIPGDLQAMLRLPLRLAADQGPPAMAERAMGPAPKSDRGLAAAGEVAATHASTVADPAPPSPPASSPTMPPPPPSVPPPAVRAAAAPVLSVVVPGPSSAPAVVPGVSSSTAVVPATPATPVRSTPSHRPSSAPWTREVSSRAELPADSDDVAAGVPRAMAPTTKRATAIVVALAAVFLVAGGVYSVRMRQQREAAEAQGGKDLSAAAPTAAEAVEPPVPTASTPTPPSAEVASAVPEPAASAAVANDEPSSAPTNAETAVASATGPLPLAALALVEPPAPAAPVRNVRETLLNINQSLSSKSPLVRDAERALLKGDTDRAQALSQQAVAENPGDADAWLTLAAARKASGDMPAAREAYRSCIEQAHTVDLDHCRILAAQ